jgi:hypothetical protein
MSWIRFGEPTQRGGQKTMRFGVTTADNRRGLGVVAWYAQWRRYGFYPLPGTVFEQDCLREIAAFCEAKTREHKAARKENP